MLPRWAVSNEQSIADEAAEYVSLSPVERLELLDTLCSDVEFMLATRPDGNASRALEYRDPLPESSSRLLAGLRQKHQAARPFRG